MGLFDKIKEPIFLRESNLAEEHLSKLKNIKEQAPDSLLPQLERDIKITEAGIAGENQIKYELANSYMPMVVLHDLYFVKDGHTAQIDYMIITKGCSFIVECKNLIGNIEIDSTGNFTRTFSYGKFFKKEGVYSPITQNQRHMEVIKMIRMESKSNTLAKMLVNKNFPQQYRSIVVLANPKTVLNAKHASKEVKNQVIRADQLIAYIKKVNKEKDVMSLSEKEMINLANFFLEQHRENPKDYLEKYKEVLTAEPKEEREEAIISPVNAEKKEQEQEQESQRTASGEEQILCQKCGAVMIRRTASKGIYVGNEFYGCSNFPKCRSTIPISEV